MKKWYFLGLFLGLCMGILACSDDKEEELVTCPEKITLSLGKKGPLAFEASGGKDSITLFTNASSWTAVTGDKWARLEKREHSIVLRVTENDCLKSRNTFVEVTAGKMENKMVDTVWVKQVGQKGCMLAVASQTIEFAADAARAKTANVVFLRGNAAEDEVSVFSEEDVPEWIEWEWKNVNLERGTADLVIKLKENTSMAKREYDLVLAIGEGARQDRDTIRIVQAEALAATITCKLSQEMFDCPGGEIDLLVNVTPARGFIWYWENEEPDWVTVDDSRQGEKILKLTAAGAIEGEEARSVRLVLETLGAVPVVVTIAQKAAPKEFDLGDIITDEAGEAVGIVVRKKAGDVPGLMMSLKEFKIGYIFKVENVIPDLINSKDGEINTKAILEKYGGIVATELHDALNGMNRDGEAGWYLPSPDEMCDIGEYVLGIPAFDRSYTDLFAYTPGTEGEKNTIQFNKVDRLIKSAGGDNIGLGSYYFTSMMGKEKFGAGRIYSIILGNSSPFGKMYSLRLYMKDYVGKTPYNFRLVKKIK